MQDSTIIHHIFFPLFLGIGDGGNELGMGKLKEKVKALIPNGSLIACDVPADYAITAGMNKKLNNPQNAHRVLQA